MDQKLYVELDALLDTRIATLAQLSPSMAIHALHHGYADRISDEMQLVAPDVTNADYAAAYAARDVETLLVARPTQMAYVLHDIIVDMEREQRKVSPGINDLVIELNIWPYALEPDESRLIAAAVAARCGIDHYIDVVSIPTAQLTLDKIKTSEWSIMIMYNFQEWWVAVMRRYKERPTGVPTCCMVAPALLLTTQGADDPKPRTLPDGRVLDPFDTLVMCMADIIGLQFLSPTTYCLYNLPTA